MLVTFNGVKGHTSMAASHCGSPSVELIGWQKVPFFSQTVPVKKCPAEGRAFH
jgi:hypothetical protein